MRSVEEASNAMALDGIMFEGAPVKVRRPTDYNPSLAAALGPSQPNPNLNLAVVWQKLTKTNYTQWSLVMKIKMQARNLWEAIQPGDVTLQEDRMTLDAITSAVPDEIVAALAVKETALEAWNAVKDMRIGSELVRKAKAQRLRREFESDRIKGGEGVDNFVLQLQGLVAELGMVGETIEPRKVVEKLL
jgi:hypothetical protein